MIIKLDVNLDQGMSIIAFELHMRGPFVKSPSSFLDKAARYSYWESHVRSLGQIEQLAILYGGSIHVDYGNGAVPDHKTSSVFFSFYLVLLLFIGQFGCIVGKKSCCKRIKCLMQGWWLVDDMTYFFLTKDLEVQMTVLSLTQSLTNA